MKQSVVLGLALGAFGYAWLLLEKALGLHGPRLALYPYFILISLVPTLLLWQWGMRRVRLALKTDVSFARLFQSGLVAVGVWALLTAAGQGVFHTWVSPRFLEEALARAVASGVDPAQAASTYGLKSYIIQNLAGTLSQGVVLAAGFAYFGSRAAAAHRKAEAAVKGMMQSAQKAAKPGKRA
jgi:hypothetical protein